MKKLVFLFVLTMFVGSLASATDYHLTKGDETTTYSAKFDALWSTLKATDTVYIDDSSVYYIGTSSNDAGYKDTTLPCMIIGTAAAKPTITFKPDTAGGWGIVTMGANGGLKNVIIDAGGPWLKWHMPIVTRSQITLYMVDMINWGGSPVVAFNGIVGQQTGGSLQYVTCDMAGSVIEADINSDWAPKAADALPLLINHCTFKCNGGGPFIRLKNNWLTDGSEITVKNSIVVQANQDTPMDMFFSESVPGEKINHHHNLYGNIAQLDFNSTDGDTTDVAGMAAKGEIGGVGVKTDPLFAKGSLRLLGGSPAMGKADDGKNMGADISSVPVELSTFELE
jgi:hypothetical protein